MKLIGKRGDVKKRGWKLRISVSSSRILDAFFIVLLDWQEWIVIKFPVPHELVILMSLSNTFDLVSLQFYFFQCANIFHNFFVFIC